MTDVERVLRSIVDILKDYDPECNTFEEARFRAEYIERLQGSYNERTFGNDPRAMLCRLKILTPDSWTPLDNIRTFVTNAHEIAQDLIRRGRKTTHITTQDVRDILRAVLRLHDTCNVDDLFDSKWWTESKIGQVVCRQPGRYHRETCELIRREARTPSFQMVLAVQNDYHNCIAVQSIARIL